MFSVRYELNLYILFRINSAFKGLIALSGGALLLGHSFNYKFHLTSYSVATTASGSSKFINLNFLLLGYSVSELISYQSRREIRRENFTVVSLCDP
jgi:hypothetical protein